MSIATPHDDVQAELQAELQAPGHGFDRSFDRSLDQSLDRSSNRPQRPIQGRDGRPLAAPATAAQQPLPKHVRPSYAPEAGPRYTCGACRSPLYRVERTAAERRIENSRRMRCSAPACGWEGLLTSQSAALDNRGAAAWGVAGVSPQRTAAAQRLRKRSLLLPALLGLTVLAGVVCAAVLAWHALGSPAAAGAADYPAPAVPTAVGVAADGMTLTSPSLVLNNGPVLDAAPAAAGK